MDTLQTWKNKVRASVPGWVFSQEGQNAVAFFDALAEVFFEYQKNMLANIAETFIDRASGTFLDQHAIERGLPRDEGETDSELRDRIRNREARPDREHIREALDSRIDGKANLYENDDLAAFEGGFLGDDTILRRRSKRNAFVAVAPKQTKTNEELQPAVDAVNNQRAFGTSWMLWVRV